MKPSMRHRLPEVGRQVGQVPNIAREAARRAVNATARSGRQAVYAAMRQAFDRPTPYTLNSVRVEEAQTQQLQAAVMVKGRPDALGGAVPQQSYLRAQVQGGARRWKKFEVALMRRGILPRGWYAMPGKGARVDGYGNMSAGQVVQLMAWLQLFNTARGDRQAGRRSNTSAKGLQRLRSGTARRFGIDVVVSSPLQAYRRGGLPFGIYTRQTNQRTKRTHGAPAPLLPVVVFVRSAQYRQRLDFFGTLQQHAQQQFPRELDAALPAARRARPLRDAA